MDPPRFMFVNLTQDKRSKDRRTAKEIRTHVMQDIGKTRRKTKNNVKIPLRMRSPPPPPLAQSRLDVASVIESANPAGRRPREKAHELEPYTPEYSVAIGLSRPFLNQDPLEILDDCWGMDPFALYTIALVLRGNTTISYSCADPLQRTEYFLFPFAPAHSRSIRDLLGSPNVRHAVVRDVGKGTAVCQRRYLSGLRCINGSIASLRPRDGLETNVIVAIIGFICYNYACQDFVQAGIHFAGLRGMLNRGGGIGSLPAQIRLMVMWIDITTALIQNHPPHYALPVDLLPTLLPPPPNSESSRQIEYMTSLMLGMSPDMSNVVHIYRDLKRLAAWLDTPSAMPGIEKDSLSISLFLDPIAHRALTDLAPFMYIPSSPPLAKACALAALMIIVSLRRKFDSFPPGAIPSYPITITDALRNSEMGGSECLTLRLWLLTIAGILTTDHDERYSARTRLVAEIKAAGLRHWKDLMDRISPMPWFEGVWKEEFMLLGEDVMSKLHLSETTRISASG
ncbi:hypothetical protein F4808DRAFT_404666 [Astrocystis sublimbata]|nr:hypothetical protein F4808DRAFT_404666 [Astrocystis sublimbata]